MKTGARGWTPEFALKFLIVPPVLFLLPTFFIPLAIVLFRAFGGTAPSFGNFTEIVSNPIYLSVIGQTFKTAAYSTVVCLILGFPIAHVITNARKFWANIGLALVLVPFWTSVVTRTFAWITILGRRGLVNNALVSNGLIEEPLRLMYNMFAVQVGMVHFLLPMMILPLVNTMRQLDHTKLLAAEILGANPFRKFWHIYVPMCLPGIMAGGMLVFITALGFYVTPALLGSERDMMIAVLIEREVTQSVNWQLASALATVLLVMVLLTLSLIVFIARRRGIRLEVTQ